jgi:hypothetical protein
MKGCRLFHCGRKVVTKIAVYVKDQRQCWRAPYKEGENGEIDYECK